MVPINFLSYRTHFLTPFLRGFFILLRQNGYHAFPEKQKQWIILAGCLNN